MSLAEVCAACLEMSMWSFSVVEGKGSSTPDYIQWWCDFEVL